MIISLFEPDIPQNTGSFVRLCACTGVPLHIIEPCGFPLDDARLKRSMMDYYELAAITRHASWEAFLRFCDEREGTRIILLTTKAAMPYTEFSFKKNDILLLGRESSGAPQAVHERADARITIPMQNGARSLNVALAASMVLGEALRQTR